MPKTNLSGRGEKRVFIELDVDLSTYGRYHLSRLSNVSIGGAFIVTRKPEPVGSVVKLKFKLPDDVKPIEATGNVVWVFNQPGKREPNSSGMGIQFTEIDEKNRARIAAFIESVKNSVDE